MGLKISIAHDSNSKANYPIYDGLTNSLINPFEANLDRKLKLTFEPAEPELWDGKTIKWSINNSMAYIPQDKVDNAEECIYRIKPNFFAGL